MSRTRLALVGVSALLLLATTPAGAWITTFKRLGAVANVQVTTAGDVVTSPGPDVVKLSAADGSIIWRASDVSTSNGSLPSQGGPSLVLDGAGDVLTIGTSFSSPTYNVHLTKLKGTTGATLWTAEPFEGGSGAIAVDAAGDVIALGNGMNGLEVAKLAGADGSPLWEYDLAAGYGFTVTVDADGNALAAGFLNNPPYDYDLLVVKIDGSTGGELWQHVQDDGFGKGDVAWALATDAAGDVAVAGDIHGAGLTEINFAVLKLSGADGTEQWHYMTLGDDPGYGEADASSVAFDASGNVVAAGETPEVGNIVDLAVVKLDGATGAWSWRRALPGTAPMLSVDHAYRVAVDSAGNAIAVGFFRTSATHRRGRRGLLDREARRRDRRSALARGDQRLADQQRSGVRARHRRCRQRRRRRDAHQLLPRRHRREVERADRRTEVHHARFRRPVPAEVRPHRQRKGAARRPGRDQCRRPDRLGRHAAPREPGVG